MVEVAAANRCRGSLARFNRLREVGEERMTRLVMPAVINRCGWAMAQRVKSDSILRIRQHDEVKAYGHNLASLAGCVHGSLKTPGQGVVNGKSICSR